MTNSGFKEGLMSEMRYPVLLFFLSCLFLAYTLLLSLLKHPLLLFLNDAHFLPKISHTMIFHVTHFNKLLSNHLHSHTFLSRKIIFVGTLSVGSLSLTPICISSIGHMCCDTNHDRTCPGSNLLAILLVWYFLCKVAKRPNRLFKKNDIRPDFVRTIY